MFGNAFSSIFKEVFLLECLYSVILYQRWAFQISQLLGYNCEKIVQDSISQHVLCVHVKCHAQVLHSSCRESPGNIFGDKLKCSVINPQTLLLCMSKDSVFFLGKTSIIWRLNFWFVKQERLFLTFRKKSSGTFVSKNGQLIMWSRVWDGAT